MKTFLSLVSVALGLLAGVTVQAGQARVADSYVVGPKDVLIITVYDQPALGGRYVVEADGSFTFPHLGPIKAGGMTTRQIEAALLERLAKTLFRNPQVSVGIETYRSQRIFILGEVRTAGQQSLTGTMTVIEAIAGAGGVTGSAAGQAVIVRPRNSSVSAPLMPGQDATAEVIPVDLQALQRGDLTQNKQLRDGDTVYVPPAETVYVLGEVRSPGLYSIQRNTTVIQALSLAGGQTPNAAVNRIRILRIENGKKIEIRVKDALTQIVKPHDTIIVPERWF